MVHKAGRSFVHRLTQFPRYGGEVVCGVTVGKRTGGGLVRSIHARFGSPLKAVALYSTGFEEIVDWKESG